MYRFCVVHMVHDMYIWIYCVNTYVEIWIIVEYVRVGDEHARGGHDLGMA